MRASIRAIAASRDVASMPRMSDESSTAIALPEGDDYETVSGLVMARLGRIPVIGDEVFVELPPRFDHDGRPVPAEHAKLTVQTVLRHVPGLVVLEKLT